MDNKLAFHVSNLAFLLQFVINPYSIDKTMLNNLDHLHLHHLQYYTTTMLAHSIRPLLRVGARQATRHVSSTSRTTAASTSRYALLVGATAVVGALALTSERRRLWNDDRKHDYDEDLKTNRHKG